MPTAVEGQLPGPESMQTAMSQGTAMSSSGSAGRWRNSSVLI